MKINLGKIILVGATLVLFISCLIEITVELGLHAFDGFLSHHGLLLFSLANMIYSFEDLKNEYKKKRES
ncbi:MAG: hypothetical protein CMI81_02135 [Candidatus Pelagibacter sp.]|nr:hypothetical protein [Candidatus Pelagibacter sp.]|tara:strand:- start:317 stop:523 length:207 start_codon:yes stop_codon:yes gene_type:complete